MIDPSQQQLPIGVFDSGVGGLTVLHALQAALPGESFVYLGDTARLPYGTKSAATIEKYALRASAHLVGIGIKALVVACNTASSVALLALRREFADMPVFGVVEPGAAAACARSRNGRIAVIATASTVRGGAYQRAILARRGDARVFARPCPLLVALAEEGWCTGEVPTLVVEEYLRPWLQGDEGLHRDEGLQGNKAPDTLLFGCTHYPLLAPVIAQVVGERMVLVDSAATTASDVARTLADAQLLNPVGQQGGLRLFATDDAERFARVGTAFMGEQMRAADVEVVDL